MGNEHNSLVISYLVLRKLLGGLGVALPIILVAGTSLFLDINYIQPSISHYYHTGMRDVFVCILSSFGLFLFSYTGYKPIDNWLSSLAGICALGVAFFPTSPGDCHEITCLVHLASATCFLLLLACMSYFLFTKSDKSPGKRTPRKRQRNRVYRVCAITIVICLILLAIYFLADTGQFPSATVFWLEVIALWAFGFSWLVKGETILKDRKVSGDDLSHNQN